MKNWFNEHKTLGYSLGCVVIAILVIAILIVSLNTAEQENTADTEEAVAESVIKTDSIYGLDYLSFLDADTKDRFVSDLVAYIKSLDKDWPIKVVISKEIKETSTGADIYFTIAGEKNYYLCSYDSTQEVPFIFCPVDETVIEGIAEQPSVEDITVTKTEPQQSSPSTTSPTQSTPLSSTQTQTQTPAKAPNYCPVTNTASISKYLPESATEQLPHQIKNYLANKGISANGMNAQVDLNSFTTGKGLIEFIAIVESNDSRWITLDCEYNTGKSAFGMRIK